MVLWKRHPEVGDGYALLDRASRMEAHRRYADQDYEPYHDDHFDGGTGRALCAHMMLNLRDSGRGATLNWARINELPAWFVAVPGMRYRICFNERRI